MIWGKTYKEKRERIASVKNWFAWYPIRLADGRWCWWERTYYTSWTSWGSSGNDYTLFNESRKEI